MRLAEIIALVRDKLNDEDRRQYEDVEIVRWINTWQSSFFRDQVTADDSYANHHVALLGSNAVQLSNDEYEYELPSWVHTVVQVRDDEPTSSPRGRTYRPVNDWIWERRSALRMRRQSTPPDILVQVTKVPARVTMGTTPAGVSSAANELVLTNTPLFPDGTAAPSNEVISGAYINSVVELTGLDTTAPHLVSGQIRRVTNSERVVTAGAVYTKLTLASDWAVTPTYGTDTYEFHPEISDSHIQLLVLRCAESIFQRTNNVNAIQVLQPQLAWEHEKFRENIEPRDSGNPGFWKTQFEELQHYDPDRADLLGWYY